MVRVRLPSGGRVSRRFNLSDTAEVIRVQSHIAAFKNFLPTTYYRMFMLLSAQLMKSTPEIFS